MSRPTECECHKFCGGVSSKYEPLKLYMELGMNIHVFIPCFLIRLAKCALDIINILEAPPRKRRPSSSTRDIFLDKQPKSLRQTMYVGQKSSFPRTFPSSRWNESMESFNYRTHIGFAADELDIGLMGYLYEPSIMCILSSSVVRSSANITSSIVRAGTGVDDKWKEK